MMVENPGSVEAVRREINVRIDSVVKTLDQFMEDNKRVPTEIDKRADRVQEILTEKIEGLRRELGSLVVRFEAEVEASRLALSTALDARERAFKLQNDATAAAAQKSESAITNSAGSDRLLSNTRADAMTEKLNDVASRVTAIENKTLGMGTIIAGIATILGLLIALAAATGAFRSADSGDSSARGTAGVLTVPAAPTGVPPITPR